MNKDQRLAKYLKENPQVKLLNEKYPNPRGQRKTPEERRLKINETTRKYRLKNLEKIRKYQREWYRNKRGSIIKRVI